jgi:hypothetical protein
VGSSSGHFRGHRLGFWALAITGSVAVHAAVIAALLAPGSQSTVESGAIGANTTADEATTARSMPGSTADPAGSPTAQSAPSQPSAAEPTPPAPADGAPAPAAPGPPQPTSESASTTSSTATDAPHPRRHASRSKSHRGTRSELARRSPQPDSSEVAPADRPSEQPVGPAPPTAPDAFDTQVEPPQAWPPLPGPSPNARLMPPRRLLPPLPPPPNRYVRVPSFGELPQ